MIVQLLLRRSINVITLCNDQSPFALSIRSLFNRHFLGLTTFQKKRDELLAAEHEEGRYLKKVQEMYETPNGIVLSHQVKNMCYYAKTTEDVGIVGKALERYCKTFTQNKIVFQIFSTGPEIMRMYHFLNLPIEGLSVIQNPDTSIMFNDIKSYFILQDLLYNNGFYSEVCQLFKILQNKQVHNRTFPFLNYIMFQAACHKMKTSESYNDAMEVFRKFIVYYSKPAWPLVMYTMIIALENGEPKLPLQYQLGKDSISINIKLSALIKTGNIEQAFRYFSKLSKKSEIIQSVASELNSNKEKYIKNEFDKKGIVFEENKDINFFRNQTFEELAAETISSMKSFIFSQS